MATGTGLRQGQLFSLNIDGRDLEQSEALSAHLESCPATSLVSPTRSACPCGDLRPGPNGPRTHGSGSPPVRFHERTREALDGVPGKCA